MNTTSQQFRQAIEYAFGHLMPPVIDIEYEDVTDVEEPAAKPRLQMLQTVQAVHVTDEDYEEMTALIQTQPSGQFHVVYEMESCNIGLYGFIDRYDSLGDGYDTPQEEIVEIQVYAYEALNEDGDDVDTDFDPKKIN